MIYDLIWRNFRQKLVNKYFGDIQLGCAVFAYLPSFSSSLHPDLIPPIPLTSPPSVYSYVYLPQQKWGKGRLGRGMTRRRAGFRDRMKEGGAGAWEEGRRVRGTRGRRAG